MTLYLTGSTGFVGTNLQKYLAGSTFELEFLGRERLKAISQIKFDSHSTIIHLAGKAHDLNKVSKPDEYYQVNYELTKELYDAFLRSGACKFIFISSVKASADSVENILTETDSPSPKTHYGKSKLMAEEYIQSRLLPEGKSYYILRPCMIHGPGNKGNLNLLYKLVSRGIPYPLAAFNNKRSFLSVENLCFVIGEILERSDIPSGVYQVADEDSLSTNQIVSLIAQELEKPYRSWELNPQIIKILAILGDALYLPLNTEKLKKMTENYLVSNLKLKSALKKELPVKAVEGMISTIKSFKD